MTELAYAVSHNDDDELGAKIVWSDCPEKACVSGARLLGCDADSVIAERAPWADDLCSADLRELAQRQLERGWAFETHYYDVVSIDDNPFVDDIGKVWRSPFQWLAWTEKRIATASSR